MTTDVNYLNSRRKYSRPQAMLWSDNPGAIVDEAYVPIGFEIGSNPPEGTDISLLDQFLILSDDNREPIQFSNERIETRQRMINGRMRSYYVADKLKISTSWTLLPSRAFSVSPGFDEDGRPMDVINSLESFNESLSGSPYEKDNQYTTDGGAGGVELLRWHESHPGSFWVFLAYDRYDNFEGAENQYANFQKYNQVIEMFVSDFSYSVERRGGSNFDFWNISVSLEEV